MGSYGVETTGSEIIQALGDQNKGKTIVITGPSKGGIGAEIASTLANVKPEALILLGRTESKVTPVIESIKEQSPETKVTFIQCDLCKNASIKTAAEQILSSVASIDVLINNAGVMAVASYKTSDDGVEQQFAAGYLGHFLLTNLLMKPLLAAKGVVLNLTSSAYALAECNTEDPNFEDGKSYDPWTAYGRTKTADILFSYALVDRYGDSGLTSFAVDPGMVAGTNLMANSGVDGELMQKGFAMAVERNGGKPLPPHQTVSLQQGCATVVLASLDSSLQAQSPAFLKECAVMPTLPYAHDVAEASKLWTLSEKLVGETFA